MRQKCFEYQYLQTLNERTNLLTAEKSQLQRLIRGYSGESNLDKLAQSYFRHPELVMDDLNLVYQNERIQVDKLIVVGNVVYLIDVKNYLGSYTYQNNSWYCGNKLLTNNIFRQIDRAHDVLMQIFYANGLSLEIRRVLIFMDPTVKVEIKQPIGQKILQVEEVAAWLMKLNNETKIYPQENAKRWYDTLTKYSVPPYRPQEDFSSQTKRVLRPGICCPKCHKFDWTTYRYYLCCCHCGFCQSKEQAYVSTICDHGVLFFKENLKRKELKQFFGKDWSEKYIRTQLKKHFCLLSNHGRSSCYQNKGLKFEYWFKNQQDYFKALERRQKWKKN